jgi:hypothetical protein
LLPAQAALLPVILLLHLKRWISGQGDKKLFKKWYQVSEGADKLVLDLHLNLRNDQLDE